MEPRNWIGITFIIAGVVLQPIGWMYFFSIQILSFVLIAIGAFIFVTQKYLDKAAENESRSSGGSGSGMPGDIHGHSGWDKGGRSDSWSSGVGSDGGGGE